MGVREPGASTVVGRLGSARGRSGVVKNGRGVKLFVPSERRVAAFQSLSDVGCGSSGLFAGAGVGVGAGGATGTPRGSRVGRWFE